MSTFKRFIDTADEGHVAGRTAAELPEFIRLGLTDSAILSLDKQEVQLLTVDHDLHTVSARMGFDVVNVTPLLLE
jgi:hypothetical protein